MKTDISTLVRRCSQAGIAVVHDARGGRGEIEALETV